MNGRGSAVEKIRVRCDCGTSLLVPEAFLGGQICCPRCERLVRVVESVERKRPEPPPFEDAFSPAPRHRPRAARRQDPGRESWDGYEDDGCDAPDFRPVPRLSRRPAVRPRPAPGAPTSRIVATVLAAAFLAAAIAVVAVAGPFRRSNVTGKPMLSRPATFVPEPRSGRASGAGPVEAKKAPEPISSRSPGERFEFGGYAFTVSSAKVLPSLAGAPPPPPDAALVAIECEIENPADREAPFPFERVALVDHFSETRPPSVPATAAYAAFEAKRGFSIAPLPAGAKRPAAFVFVVPRHSLELRALFQIREAPPKDDEIAVVIRLPAAAAAP